MAEQDRDFIVRVWVPLDVRIENFPSPDDAVDVAREWVATQEPIGGRPIHDVVEDAVEWTAFYVAPVDEWRYEVGNG